MNGHRRAGAPRLIDWTGERCVPWAPDIQVVYEHLHRYLWAAELVRGRRVLDLASGEGFGTAILAGTGSSVIGIDLDPTTVDHSRLNYELEFQVADALDLSTFADGSFGAVVALELIEHVSDHARLMSEITRVLEPGGLLVVSTPDRRVYTEAEHRDNPFHVHELDSDEFRAALAERFANVAIWGQRTIAGSALSPLEADGAAPPARTQFIERDGDGWRPAGPAPPLYLVAVASDAALPATPTDAILADGGLELLRHERAEAYRVRLERTERELGDRIVDLDCARMQIERLRGDAAATGSALINAQEQLGAARQQVGRMEASLSWRAFERLRETLFRLAGGERALPVRAAQLTLRTAARVARATSRGAPGAEPVAASSPAIGPEIVFPVFSEPVVSIVIPVYAHGELTRRCLESIRDNTWHVAYEVVIVDDTADADAKRVLAGVRGAEIIVNASNLGYLRSVNAGAAVARGRWLVLANNDIEVFPEWLEALVRCGESAPDIGVVTPKFLSPELHLSEAGGIVWRDGSAGNVGRGERTDSWRYEYRRDVDYGSAAALLVRADFWAQRGGYDERFLPMYYEDTDLCFDAREHGLRVVYEPEANVVHHEGSTAGTDLTTGFKRYQDQNRLLFVAKWRKQLESAQSRPSPRVSRTMLDRRAGSQVLIVDHRVPTPDRDSGSVRMRAMIDALSELGCRITFLPDNLEPYQPYTRQLQRLGVEVLYPPINLLAELTSLGPRLDLVVLCRPQTTSSWLDLLVALAPNARMVYDTVDLHWVREARRYALETGAVEAELGPRATVLRELELALMRLTDTTLVVTEAERCQVEAEIPGADVQVVPNVHTIRDDVPPFGERGGLLFVGGFEHTPNIEAALRLVRRVMPRVWRERPDVTVTLVGPDAPPEVEALTSSRVTVAGWVSDIGSLLGSSVALLAPLSYGAGLKGKVTQAMAAGLPVVTTSVGAEGLDAIDGEHLLLGDDDDALASAVIRLLDDGELWARLSQTGQALVAERLSTARMKSELERLLEPAAEARPPRAGSGVPSTGP